MKMLERGFGSRTCAALANANDARSTAMALLSDEPFLRWLPNDEDQMCQILSAITRTVFSSYLTTDKPNGLCQFKESVIDFIVELTPCSASTGRPIGFAPTCRGYSTPVLPQARGKRDPALA